MQESQNRQQKLAVFFYLTASLAKQDSSMVVAQGSKAGGCSCAGCI